MKFLVKEKLKSEMLYIVKSISYIKHIDSIVEQNFPTHKKTFKAYYFPYVRIYLRSNMEKLAPLLNFVRGV